MTGKRILVALEDHGIADCLSAYVCAHEWPRDSEFMLLYIVDPSVLSNGAPIHALKRAHDYGEKLLHDFAESFQKQTNIVAQTRLQEGVPVHE
ncbi:MAG TPA: hypothetical protein V6C72_12685, partial [Chroococcales cyanobacterium]